MRRCNVGEVEVVDQPLWKTVVVSVVMVFGAISFFLIHNSLVLFRVANVVVTLTHLFVLWEAANETRKKSSALVISVLLFLLSFVLKYPVRFV